MKPISVVLLGMLAAAKVSAFDAGVEYVTQDIEFDEVSAELKGLFGALYFGDSTENYIGGYSLSDSSSGIDYRGVELGAGAYFYQSETLGSKVELTLGYGHADVPWYKNENQLISLGAGISGHLVLLREVRLTSAFGYKHFFDATGDAECFDGYETDRTDVGACAEHGGVYYYQNSIGHGGGLYYRIGLAATF